MLRDVVVIFLVAATCLAPPPGVSAMKVRDLNRDKVLADDDDDDDDGGGLKLGLVDSNKCTRTSDCSKNGWTANWNQVGDYAVCGEISETQWSKIQNSGILLLKTSNLNPDDLDPAMLIPGAQAQDGAIGKCFAGGGDGGMYPYSRSDECSAGGRCYCMRPEMCWFDKNSAKGTDKASDGITTHGFCRSTRDCAVGEGCRKERPNFYPNTEGRMCMIGGDTNMNLAANKEACLMDTSYEYVNKALNPSYSQLQGHNDGSEWDLQLDVGCKCVKLNDCTNAHIAWTEFWYSLDCEGADAPGYCTEMAEDLEKFGVALEGFIEVLPSVVQQPVKKVLTRGVPLVIGAVYNFGGADAARLTVKASTQVLDTASILLKFSFKQARPAPGTLEEEELKLKKKQVQSQSQASEAEAETQVKTLYQRMQEAYVETVPWHRW